MAPLFFFIILLTPLCHQVYSTDPSFEKTVLLSLKQHWGNPISLHSWNSTSHHCDWLGVDCTSDAVTGLYLAHTNISGTIPLAICQLKNLVLIYLYRNDISGHVPACLYNCSDLEILDLSSNKLSGTIPGELFLMKRLRILYLDRNRLSREIPISREAYSLEYLNLSDNRLSGTIPDDISNLKSLVDLDLSKNALIGTIPDDISKLYNLEHLDLSKNVLSGTISRGLFNMHKLRYLSIGYNNLSSYLPAEFNLVNLVVLNLSRNNLNGAIPRVFEKLPSSTTVDLSGNKLSGDIIDTLFRLKSGHIMQAFSQLDSKCEVSLFSNKFSGKVPYEFLKQNFSKYCLDLPNLCSDNRNQGLERCPSNLCLDDRVKRFLICNSRRNESGRHFIIIIILVTVGPGIVGLVVLCYIARKCLRTTRCNHEEEWEMISFQMWKFNKTDLLSGLTDENLIGNGGQGKVYRVFINQTGNYVAVKSISNARKSNNRFEKEFLAEIRTVGNISHYNIVKLLCCISGKDLKLLVYQFFENKSLDQWLYQNNSTLDWSMRLHIAIGIAQGLCYLHHHCSPPIIHRDIKTSNILLDSEFNAKIADFGLAKLLTSDGNTETASDVAGTFGYIAPEYAYTTKLNTKTDVYSFGVVLLELTTRRKAVTPGDHTNLAGWAQLRYWDTNAIIDALDAEIKESTYIDQITKVFQLGVICTATLPPNRPSMKDCLQILQNCRINSSSSSPEPSQLSDQHPLL